MGNGRSKPRRSQASRAKVAQGLVAKTHTIASRVRASQFEAQQGTGAGAAAIDGSSSSSATAVAVTVGTPDAAVQATVLRQLERQERALNKRDLLQLMWFVVQASTHGGKHDIVDMHATLDANFTIPRLRHMLRNLMWDPDNIAHASALTPDPK